MITKSLLLLLLFATADAPPLKPTKVEALAWLTGQWSATIDGVETEEIWSSPAGGVMIGMHRDVRAKRTDFEFFRIAETEEGLVYYAQPSGRPPTPFKLTQADPHYVIFSNPEHDFPKRIFYSRDGDTLCASVDGGEGTDQEKWCWKKK